jgi:NAD(P)-dependent dehydrogenase (short-subunit alcohol dehydrogenase family)
MLEGGANTNAAARKGNALFYRQCKQYIWTSGLNAPYAAVKHGVVGLTKSAALDYARSGIRINAICPAFVVTPMTSPFYQENTPEGDKFKNRIPMGRLGTPEEVAHCILWLLSSASAFTTGSAITVDGGISCL